jgi:membrane-associated phospholipid phosphatase
MPRRTVVPAALGLLGFLILAGLVLAHPEPFPLDRWLHRLAVEHRTPVLGIARAWTHLGETPVILPLLLLAGVVYARRLGRWLFAVVGLLLLLAGTALRYAAMVIIDRPRPPVGDWARFASGTSFPSGHTTTSALGYGLILLLLADSVRRPAGKAALAGLLLVVAALVGVSRVVLGVHWPTDVFGGWCLALFAASLSALVLRRLAARSGAAAVPAASSSRV